MPPRSLISRGGGYSVRPLMQGPPPAHGISILSPFSIAPIVLRGILVTRISYSAPHERGVAGGGHRLRRGPGGHPAAHPRAAGPGSGPADPRGGDPALG